MEKVNTLIGVIGKAITKALKGASGDREVPNGDTLSGVVTLRVRFSSEVGEAEGPIVNTAAVNRALSRIGLLALQRLNAESAAAAVADAAAGRSHDPTNDRIIEALAAIEADPETFKIAPVFKAGKVRSVVTLQHFRVDQPGEAPTIAEEAARVRP